MDIFVHSFLQNLSRSCSPHLSTALFISNCELVIGFKCGD
uniref:Uncharacterized protein n=1 Tax=Anguilla anguilla TaxID=7936 RepID=A0A0E9SW34_ANGAN